MNRPRPSPNLAIYLRNHEAASQAGLDLFRRTAAAQRRRTYGGLLRELRDEVRSDVDSLHQVMRALRVRPNPLLAAALRTGERVGRLKPNGRLIRRSPLSDLVEIEALGTAARAKASGWRALLAIDLSRYADLPDVTELLARAEHQIARIDTLHHLTAARVLGESGGEDRT
jgi:hypothetical protein